MPPKRAREVKQQPENTALAETASAVGGQLNDYEQQRAELIARNRQRLLALGIPAAAQALALTAEEPKKPKKARVQRAPQAPTRASARLQHESAQAPEEVASELALCMINGECPRCGKALEGGYRIHLARCQGAPPDKDDGVDAEDEDKDAEMDEETEAAMKEEEAAWQQRQAAKLRGLELAGLVELDDDHAVFVVLGSTGNHYKVTLSGGSTSACQCIDFRIRRRVCKHQKLVLRQLGVAEDSAAGWREAVTSHLDSLPKDFELSSDSPPPRPRPQKASAKAAKAGQGSRGQKQAQRAAAPAAVGISDLAKLRRTRP